MKKHEAEKLCYRWEIATKPLFLFAQTDPHVI